MEGALRALLQVVFLTHAHSSKMVHFKGVVAYCRTLIGNAMLEVEPTGQQQVWRCFRSIC